MTQYKVIKETHSYRFCSHCGGSGYKVRTFRGEKMKNVCTICKGSGKEKITHRTEVSLEEALKQLTFSSGDNLTI